MTTALERAVNTLSDPTISTPDALRGLLIVVRRIRAESLGDWISHELNGYGPDDPLPAYRSKDLPIALSFAEPMRTSSTINLYTAELPEHLRWVAPLRSITNSVAELEALANGEGDSERALPLAWISQYRQGLEEGQVPGIGMMVLNHAGFLIPRTHLRGLLDGVKTAALELALQLEDVSPEVGQAQGPTVLNDDTLAAKVDGVQFRIFGDGNTVVIGDSNATAVGKKAQATALQAGDVDGLLAAARAYVDDDAVDALAEAIREDGGSAGAKTRGWLDAVKHGGYGLVGGMATNGAYDGLLALVQSVFPSG